MNLQQHEDLLNEKFGMYESLQERHLNIMKTQEMPDLNIMTLERKHASSELQKVLQQFMDVAGSLGGTKSITILTRFEGRLNTIMELDETISTEIQKHRDWLKNNLSLMKKGKQAVRGYKTAGTIPNQARVFSISR